MPEGVGSVLVGQVEEKPSTRAGVTIAVILVDPGDVGELDLLLDRVETRQGEPVPRGEGDHFGMVAAGSPARGPLSAPPKPWRGPSVPMI
jgi:hypothetical protein